MISSIAIFRRGLADRPYWPAWVRGSGIGHVVDVPDLDGLTIAALGDDRWEASCSGVPLADFDALLFLGTPGAFKLPYPSDRERLYLHLEWDAGLLAALAGLPTGRIFNPGLVFAWNRSLFEPVHMLRDLAQLGWATPVVHRHFDFVTGLIRKQRDPEPVEADKRLLVITARDFVFADRPDETPPEAVAVAARATQEHLQVWGLDWITLAMALIDGRAVAFGLQPDLPGCLPPELASRIFERALAGPRPIGRFAPCS